MAEPKNKKSFPVPFGPDGFITKRIKKQSTNTKTQKAKVEKQRQAQKKKTFVPGTLDTKPTTVYDRNNPGKKNNRPNYNQIQRPTDAEKYKKPEAKVTKVKEYRSIEPQVDYPVYDSNPSTTTTPSYTKKTDTPKAGDMEKGKKKMTGDTSLARQAMKNAQGLLKRPTRNR